MGQYWLAVDLDKKEYIDPHDLGSGLKLWEQLANSPGAGAALIILCAAMPKRRGGGDFDLDENWHGPERTMDKYPGSPGPMPEDYPTIAARTIGRWAGDRIALVGDYAENSDLAPEHQAKTIYERCRDGGEYTNITADIVRIIEHELQGKFSGDGWKEWTLDREASDAGEAPDLTVR